MLVAGCETPPSGSEPGGAAGTVRAVQHPALEGIPLPAGFRLVPDRSIIRSSGQYRYANCEYTGDTPPETVFRFFKENMPTAGFKLRQWGLQGGEYVLEFEGHSERSTVRFKQDKFRKTKLIIDVSPTPRGSVERDITPQRRP